MSPNRSLISELSASTQPYHWAFQTMDIAAGILTVACIGFVWRLTDGLSRKTRWLLTSLFAFIGIDSVIDAMLPISCAPSMDPQCHLLATHSILTTSHLIESNIAGVAVALLPLLWWWHLRMKHSIIAQLSFWFGITQLVLGIAALAVRLSGRDTYGILQRIYESGLGIWMGTVIGIAALRQPAALPAEDSVDLTEDPAQLPSATVE
jgi:hypothetical protein